MMNCVVGMGGVAPWKTGVPKLKPDTKPSSNVIVTKPLFVTVNGTALEVSPMFEYPAFGGFTTVMLTGGVIWTVVKSLGGTATSSFVDDLKVVCDGVQSLPKQTVAPDRKPVPLITT